ncbi:hypothetical protein KA005_78305 [bacterium]|nr:hypothetical protein [bacterium]
MKALLSPYYRTIQSGINRILIKIFKPEGIIILGCGRSGTQFSAKYLTQQGFRVGHERLKYNGISSWFLAVQNTQVPSGPNFEMVKNLGFTIIHQVREPLASISSIQALGKPNWRFIASNIPIDLSSDTKTLMAMKYWFHWNKMAEQITEYRVKVENFQDDILKYIDSDLKNPGKEKEITKNDKINTRKHTSLSWEDLEKEDEKLAMEIKQLAKKYGY